MKIHRIWGMTLRYLYLFRHSLERLTDAFYWPAIDLFIWGLTSSYLKRNMPDTSMVVLIIISGLLLWLIVWRAHYEVTGNLLVELWNKNLINILVSPLKFSEWIFSYMFIGIVKMIISLIFASSLAFLLYEVNILSFGFYLLPFIILLVMTGWWIGFLIAGIILRIGSRFDALAWSAIALISPFSAIYYPVSILPDWAQKISLLIPTSYVFEGAREVIFRGSLDPSKLVISFLLNTIYFILSLIFLYSSFKKLLNNGVASFH